jgi:hypothetical protein
VAEAQIRFRRAPSYRSVSEAQERLFDSDVYVLWPFEPFEHEQVWVSHGEMRASVDVGLAKVIPALWREGILTEMSCQGTPAPVRGIAGFSPARPAWIMFPRSEDLTRFCGRTAKIQGSEWAFSQFLGWGGAPRFHVEFPSADLPAVEAVFCGELRRGSSVICGGTGRELEDGVSALHAESSG